MNSKAYKEQGIDIRRMALTVGRQWYKVLIAAVIGAALGALLYEAVIKIKHKESMYRISADYYITFNFDEYEHGDDYYNAYTWDNILRDDPIVDTALEYLPENITKDKVKAAVTGEMLGDYRILTVHVTTADQEEAKRIADAYEHSLERFGQEIPLLLAIEQWSREELEEVKVNDKTVNAACLGGILAGIGALTMVMYYYLLLDACFTEKEVTDRFGLTVYGVRTVNQDKNEEVLLQKNLSLFGKDREILEWPADKIPIDEEEMMKDKVVMLLIPWGKNIGRSVERVLHYFNLHEIEAAGAILTEADDHFWRRYYGGKK